MELALTYPERVANLVVVDIAPVPYDSTLMHTVYNVTLCCALHARPTGR